MTACTSDGRAHPRHDQQQHSEFRNSGPDQRFQASHAAVLEMLDRAGSLHVGQLVAALGLSAASGLRVIVDLADTGRVRIRSHPVDHRVLVVDPVARVLPSIPDSGPDGAVVAVAC